MSLPKSTQIKTRVIEALQAIRTNAGFRTDAGLRVHRSRSDDLGDTRKPAEWPCIRVTTNSETTTARRPRQSMKERLITVEGLATVALVDYEPMLDALAEDIERALLPLTEIDSLKGLATEVEISGADYMHPDPGSELCSVTFTVTVSYVLTL